MSKAVNAIIVGLTVFILLTGSIWYVTVARGPSKVSAVEVEQGWESVNETAAVMWGQVTFENPYDFRIDLVAFHYEFWINNKRWAHNNSTDDARLAPRGEATLPARVILNTTDIDDWLDDHIANGERTEVRFMGNATFRVGGGELSVPFERRQSWETQLRRNLEELRNCPQDEPSPCISDTAVKWVVDNRSTSLQLMVTVRNNNLDEMTISNRSATLALGGVTLASTSASDPVRLARQSGRFVEFPLAVERAKIVDWWMHHVQACERSEATLDIVLDYEVKAQTFPPQPTTPTTPKTTTPPVVVPPTTTTSVPPTATSTTTSTSSSTTTPPTSSTTSSSPAPTTTSTTTTTSVPPTTTSSQPPPPTTSSEPPPTTSEPPPTTSSQPPPTTETTPTSSETTTTSSETTNTSSETTSSEPTTGTEPSGSGTTSTDQGWFVGLRKSFEYPWRASALQLGLLEPEAVQAARPTTNGVERVAWDLELSELRTGFACTLET